MIPALPFARVKMFDGLKLRRKDPDMIGGGHHKVYRYIPRNEIWIDTSLQPADRAFILVHEAVEKLLMDLLGWGYDRAHARANVVEGKCRRARPRAWARIIQREIASLFPQSQAGARQHIAAGVARAMHAIVHRRNPPSARYPVISYAAAHRWEPLARARGVSTVARSARGFMRAYEQAGSWARLSPVWKRRRDAFVARHTAQVRQRGERMWKSGRPSRRALALIMWAYMPGGRR